MSTEQVRLDLLHVLRLRGLAETAELSRLTGLDEASVDRLLESEALNRNVTYHSGRLVGWALSPKGRAEGEKLLAEELDRESIRDRIEADYLEFLELNGELLGVCSAWQTITVDGVDVVNDHSDTEHDLAVLERLEALHRRALHMTASLERTSSRFGGYSRRLRAAHARIVAGETEWLTRSTVDSYHSVWFELHENLLANLGRRRSNERQR
ncbi:MAG: hypothetical protein KDB26_05820 [Microthrixaceae bacterium]|nr:hypothetical protein [Microthrixaceae bacterium]